MQEHIESADGPNPASVMEAIAEVTKWSNLCKAVEILTGEREPKYVHEPAMALFILKAWLSTPKPLSYVVKNAPKVFFSLIIIEEVYKLRKQKGLKHKSPIDLFYTAVNEPSLRHALKVVFGRIDIIEFLVNNTWRPYRLGSAYLENRSEIERINGLSSYRLRLGYGGYNFTANDAASLLGAIHDEKSWGATTVKKIRSRWREKESFLFIGHIDAFSDVISFRESKIHDLMACLVEGAKNHRRNANYFASVKGIISDLTPKVSKELEKYDRWRKIEILNPIELPLLDDVECVKIDEQGIKPTVRRSAKAAYP
jgi:hypothetical protein